MKRTALWLSILAIAVGTSTCERAPEPAPSAPAFGLSDSVTPILGTQTAALLTPANSCCCPNATPGCDVDACSTCVCALDPYCCDHAHDARCVDLARGSCAASCPACGGGAPPACSIVTTCAAGGVGACDDKNRCTTGDLCDGAGVCAPGPKPNCNDQNACTKDVCQKAKGCLHTNKADGSVCAAAHAQASCAGGACTVSSCAPGWFNVDGSAANGCEYPCAGSPATPETCNAADDNCDGTVDEGCAQSCAGPELPDDGIDAACDSVEHFLSSANKLALAQTYPAGAFNIGVSGKFRMGILGPMNVTGSVARTSAGAPVGWCVTGTKALVKIGVLSLTSVEATVCRALNGTVTATMEAQAKIGTGTPFPVTGTFTMDANLSLTLSADSVPLATGLTLTNATLATSRAFASAYPYRLAITGTSVVGPFTSTLSGTLSQASAGAPVVACLTGASSATVAGLALTSVSLTVCLSGTAVTGITYSGTLAFEGQQLACTGSLSLAIDWVLTIEVPVLTLLVPGAEIHNAVFSIPKLALNASLSGSAVLGGVGLGLDLNVSGSYSVTGPLHLTLAQASLAPWTPFAGFPLSFPTFGGTLDRISAVWSASLGGFGNPVSLGDIDLSNAIGTAHLSLESAWSVEVSGHANLGPFSLNLSGTLSKAGPTAPVEGCLTANGSATVNGIPLTNTTVTVCVGPTGVESIALSGTIVFEGTTTTYSGTLVVGPPWTLTASLTGVSLGTLLTLDSLTLTFTENATTIALSAQATVGSGAQALPLTVSGSYTKTGPINLTAGLTPGETWDAIPAFGMEVTDLTGTLTRLQGNWSVSVTAAAGATTNATFATGIRLTSVGLSATYAGATGAWSFALSGSMNLGLFGTLTVTGTLSQASATAPVIGCLGVTTDTTLAGVVFDDAHVEACVTSDFGCGVGAPNNGTCVTGNFGADITLLGTAFDVDGTYTFGIAPVVTFTVSDWELAPGLVLDSATLTIDSAGGTKIGLDATTRVGTGASAVDLSLSGDIDTAGGNWTLTAGLAPGETWVIEPTLGLVVTSATGTVKNRNGVITVTLTASLGASLELVPGLVLTNAFAAATLDTEGAWIVSIGGDFTLDYALGVETIAVIATIDDSGSFVLEGSLGTDLEPIPSLGSNLVVEDVTAAIAVDTQAGTYTVSLGGEAKFCTLMPCTPVEFIRVSVEGAVIVGPTSGLWFRGTLSNLTVPILGDLTNLALLISTVPLQNFDLFNTPVDTSDDLDVSDGLSLYVEAPTPIPVGTDYQQVIYGLTVSLNSLYVFATVPLGWDIIQPSDGFPEVKRLSVDSITLSGELSGLSALILLSGQATFEPANQSSPLVGTLSIGIGVGELVYVTAEASLTGRWLDCFGLTGFAIQNLGFTMSIAVSSTPPFPESIGFTADIFWKKYGNWPNENVWPIPTEGSEFVDAPDNVAQFGGTFYFNIVPTPSGLCLLGACAPLPTFLIRIDIQNFEFPGDLANLWNTCFVAFQSFMPGNLPTVSLPPIDTSPLSINFKKMEIVASTHNLDDLFDLTWRSGFKAEIELEIGTTDLTFTGFADTSGVDLEGRIEPINLFGADFMQLVGDPYKNYYQLNGGTISIPDDDKWNISAGTIEGWVKGTGFGSADFSHVLAKKDDGTDGFTLGVGNVSGGKGKVSFRMRKGGTSQTVTTTEASIQSGQWHHVAVVYGGTSASLFVDGFKKDTTVSGTPTSLGTNASTIVLGSGFTAIDDIRYWKVQRTPAELKGESRVLPIDSFQDTSLVGRWEANLDLYTDDGKAHNTRLFDSGPPLHGTLNGGATTELELADNDLYFKLALRVPGSKGSEDGPGIWAQAGVIIDIPYLLELSCGAQVLIGAGHAGGSIYSPDFDLLPTPFGTFVLGGYGPNLFPGDFDDGLYASIDLLAGSFAATGKLAIDEPDGEEQILGGAAISYLCPPNRTCTSFLDHVLKANGDMDLTAELPLGLGDIGIRGDFDVELNSPNWHIYVNGSLVVFGYTFLSGSISINSEKIECEALVDFGIFGTLSSLVSLDMLIWELCASTVYTAQADENHSNVFDCGVSVCIGGPGFPLTPGFGCGPFCIGDSLCAEGQVCIFAVCSDPVGPGGACGKDIHCLSGDCGCIEIDGLGVNVGRCLHKNDQPIGSECVADSECASTRCSSILCTNGTCVCDEDTDCNPNQWCNSGVDFTLNTCDPDKPDGETCNRNAKCLSGHCSENNDLATCGRCFTPDSKAVGQDCWVDGECTTNRCGHVCGDPFPGKCKCRRDTDCNEAVEYCATDALDDNLCHPKKADGVSCSSSNRCLSGHCSTESDLDPCGYCYTPRSRDVGQNCKVDAECIHDQCGYVCGAPGTGKCKCDADTDCDVVNEYCGLAIGGDNLCHAKKADCEVCDDGRKCISNYCTASVSGKCIVPDGKTIGQSCCHNQECVTGQCGVDGVCVCETDDDCATDEYCAEPLGQPATCEPKKTNGEGCSGPPECISDYCNCFICRGTGKAKGATCYSNAECTTGHCTNSVLCDPGVCGCDGENDCSNTEYCESEVGGDHLCHAEKADCETCDDDRKCISNYCTANVSGKCITVGSKSIGQSCCHNDECTTNQCGMDGLCVCEVDADCADDEYCEEPVGQAATCEPKKSGGNGCSNNGECISDKCTCGYCRPVDRNLGQSCYSGAECVSNHCSAATCLISGECRCNDDGDCDSNEWCKEPLAADNTCEPKGGYCDPCGADHECLSSYVCTSGSCIVEGSKTIGQSCCENAQCVTGQCGTNDVCVCETDSDCDSDEYCVEPVGQPAYCEQLKSSGESCSGPGECISNLCVCFICRAADQPLGARCFAGSQCLSNHCSSVTCFEGECRCDDDGDCPGSQECKKPFGGENHCE